MGAGGGLSRQARRTSGAAPFAAPLVAPLIALAGGVFVSRQAGLASWEAAAGFAATMVLLAIAWRAARRLRVSVGLLAIGFAGAWIEGVQRPGLPPAIDAGPHEVVEAEGCVVEPAVVHENRQRFTLELEPGARARVTVYLKDGERPWAIGYGQRVVVTGRFREPRNFGNPGSFDYAGHLARRQVYWLGAVRGSDGVRAAAGECGRGWRKALLAMRGAALGRMERLFGERTESGAILRAALLGDDSGLEEATAEEFRRTGTYHVLVVSGVHLTALGAVLLFFLRLLRLGVTTSLVATAAAAWLYAGLCGATPPVVRAAAGLTLFAGARWFYRRPQLLNLLAATAMAFLAVDSGQLFEASFQLSFLAVGLIAAAAVPLLDRSLTPVSAALRLLHEPDLDFRQGALAEMRVELRLLAGSAALVLGLPLRLWTALLTGVGRLALYFAELALVSAVIQLGLTLPMVVYFHRLPLSALSANLLMAAPMTAAVPLGFAALLTGWAPLVKGTAATVEFSRAVAGWHASVEPAWRIPGPPVWLGAVFLVSLAGVAWSLVRNSRWGWLAAPVLAASTVALGLHPFEARTHGGNLECTLIDVGQGESVLIVSPAGRTLLVDAGGLAGPGSGRTSFDIGEDVISPYLWTRSIRRLDAVALTHADADHMGGLAAIVDNFRPAELWTGRPPPAAVLAHAARGGVTVRQWRAGDAFPWGGAAIRVLSPAEEGTGRRNDGSLVLELAHGRHRFLLTGDIERETERRLVAEQALRPADVLKVAHHGSRTSSSAGFLAAVGPVFALISAGRDNQFRHPHGEVLERLQSAGARTLRTDVGGLTSVRSDGWRISVESYRDSREH